jgi:hypothetical protein
VGSCHHLTVSEPDLADPLPSYTAPAILRLFKLSSLCLHNWVLAEKKTLDFRNVTANRITLQNVIGLENLRLESPSLNNNGTRETRKISILGCGQVTSLSCLPHGISCLTIKSSHLFAWTKLEEVLLQKKLDRLVSLKLVDASSTVGNLVLLFSSPCLEKVTRTGNDTRWSANVLAALSECRSLKILEVERWEQSFQKYLGKEVRVVIPTKGAKTRRDTGDSSQPPERKPHSRPGQGLPARSSQRPNSHRQHPPHQGLPTLKHLSPLYPKGQLVSSKVDIVANLKVVIPLGVPFRISAVFDPRGAQMNTVITGTSLSVPPSTRLFTIWRRKDAERTSTAPCKKKVQTL